MLAYLQDPNGFWQNNVIYMGDEPHPPCNDAPAFAVLGDRAISVEQGHTQATQRLLTQINQLNGEQPFSVVNRIRLRS
jgi:hypothetical protein